MRRRSRLLLFLPLSLFGCHLPWESGRKKKEGKGREKAERRILMSLGGWVRKKKKKKKRDAWLCRPASPVSKPLVSPSPDILPSPFPFSSHACTLHIALRIQMLLPVFSADSSISNRMAMATEESCFLYFSLVPTTSTPRRPCSPVNWREIGPFVPHPSLPPVNEA